MKRVLMLASLEGILKLKKFGIWISLSYFNNSKNVRLRWKKSLWIKG